MLYKSCKLAQVFDIAKLEDTIVVEVWGNGRIQPVYSNRKTSTYRITMLMTELLKVCLPCFLSVRN